MIRRAAALTAALLFCLVLPARAEGDVDRLIDAMDLRSLEESVGADGTSFDLRELLRGLASGRFDLDPEAVWKSAKALLRTEGRRMFAFLPGLMLPALVSCVAEVLAGRGQAAGIARLICYLGGALVGGRLLLELAGEAEALIDGTAAVCGAAFPLLSAFLATMGAPESAALLTPFTAFLGGAGTQLLRTTGIGLGLAAAAMAVAGNFQPRLSLHKLFGLTCAVLGWGTGLLMTLFAGALSVTGALGTGYDSAAVRAAHYAVDNLLPVIGSDVADALGALGASVGLVKNAVGVVGMLAVLIRCARPLVRLTAALVTLHLAAAVMEPLGEDRLAALTEDLARVAQALLIMAVSSVVLALLLFGATLAAGQGLMR